MSDSPSSQGRSCFVTTLDLKLADKLRKGLESQEFILTTPPYTLFSAKKKGISCTLYTSGKLMIQGKEMNHFIEFFLEPEILQHFEYSNRELLVNKTGRLGIDESGKGDFFGPLCIAGVYAEGEGVVDLIKIGVRDSKALTDAIILKLAKKIKSDFAHSIVRIGPQKYNQLYRQFQNLNKLLAWGHATVIENLILKTGCHRVVVDQFAAKHVVENALKRKQLMADLEQQHRAESDPVVAAGSILARAAFLEGLEELGSQYGLVLPKGASSKVIEIGKSFVITHGAAELENVSKLHFKTHGQIVGLSKIQHDWTLEVEEEDPFQ